MQYDVGVVGLGYVGLTLATALADTGFRVLGVERRGDIVAATNDGVPHFTEAGLPEMLTHAVETGHLTAVGAFTPGTGCDIYVITVGTPLAPDGQARVDFIEAATREVAENMADGALGDPGGVHGHQVERVEEPSEARYGAVRRVGVGDKHARQRLTMPRNSSALPERLSRAKLTG